MIRLTVELPGEKPRIIEVINRRQVTGWKRGDDTYELTDDGPPIPDLYLYEVRTVGSDFGSRWIQHWRSRGWRLLVQEAVRVAP